MTSNRKNWTVLISTMLVIGAVVLTILERNGTSDESLSLALRLTAWLSFLIYLIVFVTRPLQQVLKSPMTAKMLKNRRYFGIAMAGAFSVHLMLILGFVLKPGNLRPALLIGAAAYLLIYSMLITSFNTPAKAIGPIGWRRLHKTGLYAVGIIFSIITISKFVAAPDELAYQVFLILLIAAIATRIVAFIRSGTA
jgi:DMSO/TMAO reductase YedYZ heme-binding membrane subunit